MSSSPGSRFLGEWDVTETVYAADATRLGTVRQRRCLERVAEDGAIVVRQRCEPASELARHPMAAFRGDFTFRLEPRGRQRLYRGPDVVGSATAFGDGFLCGQGVWPRFAYNFRSWSISLGDTQQVTGGVFLRGACAVAVIVGVGSQVGSPLGAPALAAAPGFGTASGLRAVLDLETGIEVQGPVVRQAEEPGSWLEWGESHEERFRLTGEGGDYRLSRNQREVGMAKAYGPLLTWELYGEEGAAAYGLCLATADGRQQFSLRHNLRNGRLVSLEAIRLNA